MKRGRLHTAARIGYCMSFFFVFYSTAVSQTTNINGVVNSYYQVIEVIPSKAGLRVTDVSGIVPTTYAMIVQMKGATINTTNSSSFGDTTSLNNAGNYEINRICAVIGDTVFMVNDLMNAYTVADKVQIVQFAQYVSANVTDTIKAAPWNNTTGTGGVIALFAEDTLTLNAPIYATGQGYAGGAFFQSNGTCTNLLTGYTYNPSLATQNGAYKGESVATVAANINGGRGAPANGGGGGNNHNNSGGGGSNLNAGGRGGGNSSASGCNASANHKGEGGRPLSSWGGRKIFLGGGGGAGHNNNGALTLGGGNGGGIIFIHADTLIGNGYIISANGAKGGNSQADGAGGGGGGGSIIMDVNVYDDSVCVQAKGGDGGDSNDANNTNNCRGGGGGGGGGVIYFTGAVVADSINAGLGVAGLETNRHNASCGTIQPASDGTNGEVVSSYAYRSSSSLASYCAIILPVRLISFEAKAGNKKTFLQWKIAGAETADNFTIERMNENGRWIEILNLPANLLREEYDAVDNNPLPDFNLYRLKIMEKNKAVSYSAIQRVYFKHDKNSFTVYPNPAHNKVVISGNFNNTADMKLTDISGKIILIRKINSRQTEIELPILNNGTYFISINQVVRKLIIYR